MKRSIIYALAGIVVVCFGVLPQARADCNGILHAKYGLKVEDGLSAQGNSPGPTIGDFIPFATIGHETFDGSGNLSGEHDTNFGGILIHHIDSGTYSVNSDCTTGTVSIPSQGQTWNIVITGGGQEVKLVSGTAGRVFSGTLLLGAAACPASALSGNSYGFATHGLVVVSLTAVNLPRIGGFMPFADGGQISFNADGSVSGVDNLNNGGAVRPGRAIAGTYSVNPDCTGTTTMTIAGNDHNWKFVVLEGANQIIFVTATSGYVQAGTLTKQ